VQPGKDIPVSTCAITLRKVGWLSYWKQ
jgi:hypothetical protein